MIGQLAIFRMEGLGPTNSKFVVGKSIGPKLVKASELKMDRDRCLRYGDDSHY